MSITSIPAPTALQQRTKHPRSSSQVRSAIGWIIFYAVLVGGAIVMLFPFAYMVGVSFTFHAFILQTPPSFIPRQATIQNYIDAWQLGNFAQAFLNSAIVAGCATLLNVILGSMLSFAFGRYKFPGRDVMFYGMLATLSIPGLVLIIPQFVLASQLGLTNSRFGLIIVYSANMAFSVFMLRGFFMEIPQELFDAASIDGCGVFRSYWSIGIPLAKPALAAATIFSFSGCWDEFLWALTSTNDPSQYTLPVALQQFYAAHGANWGIVFAGSVIECLPILIIFFCLQRYFVSGLAGALKS